MNWRTAVVFLAAGFASQGAPAQSEPQPFTALKLQQWANSDEPMWNAMYTGYVFGVFSGQTEFACPPRDSQITADQVGKVVKKYLDGHPEMLHQDAAILTLSFLGVAFPCEGGLPEKWPGRRRSIYDAPQP